MIRDWVSHKRGLLAEHWRQLLLIAVVGLAAVIMAIQFVYPSSRLLPFTTVDGVNLSGAPKAEALSKLGAAYENAALPVYFEGGQQPYLTPTFVELGLEIDNNLRISGMTYPWYLRIIPTSLLWGHLLVQPGPAAYERNEDTLRAYLEKELGAACRVAPKNASLAVTDGRLTVVPAQPGGTCDFDEVFDRLAAATPTLGQSVTLPVDPVEPAISDDDAFDLIAGVNDRLAGDVPLQVGSRTIELPGDDVLAWLALTVKEGEPQLAVSAERAKPYLSKQIAPLVHIAPGITTVFTHDYLETSRTAGTEGRSLDQAATVAQLAEYANGTRSIVNVVTKATPPTVQYKRTYSATDTGLAALMENFAKSHPGTYGISLVEVAGQYRHASYQGDKQFITASTYKLFVAYSTLRRIESGAWEWSDKVTDSRNLARCFDDMIVLSDNECAKALLKKIGYTAITNEARAIGANRTTFLEEAGIKSTADDEARLLALLQTGQLLTKQSSRDRFINALKRNVYRQGIPKGVPSATVADKVGFLEGWLHDAAIVYSPAGTYVLVVLTNNSSWSNIAELAKQVEKLRKQ